AIAGGHVEGTAGQAPCIRARAGIVLKRLRFVGALRQARRGLYCRYWLCWLPTSEAIAEKNLSAASLICLLDAPVGVLLLKNFFTVSPKARMSAVPFPDLSMLSLTVIPTTSSRTVSLASNWASS